VSSFCFFLSSSLISYFNCFGFTSSHSQQDEFYASHSLQKEILDLQQSVHLYKHFEEKWTMEKSSLLSQIELFNDQIQSFQKKYEMIETDNRRMIQVRN
jgi:hypothetical protein